MTLPNAAYRGRALPALVLLAMVAAMAGLYAFGGDAYLAWRAAAGLKPFAPFLDLHGVMAAIECWHRGVDVYAANPCDLLGRPHVYSPLWLRLPPLFGRAELTGLFGMAMALAFIAALPVLPAAEGAWGTAALLLAVASPDTVFALERANVDVLIFAAVALAVPLLAGGLGARVAAYGVFLAVGLLKFYPLVLLGLVVREQPRVALALGVTAVALAALALAPLADEVQRSLVHILPLPAFSGTFGARNLAQGVAVLAPQGPLLAWLMQVAVAAGAMAAGLRLAGDGAVAAALAALPRRHADLLLVGALLFLGCFLAGESVEYRAVFLLLAMPALLHLAGGAALPWVFAATAWALVWLMWDPLVRRVAAWLAPSEGAIPALPGVALWALREVLWWAVAAVLAGLAVRLLRHAPGLALVGLRRL